MQGVHDVVAGLQVEEGVDRSGGLHAAEGASLAIAAEKLVVRDERRLPPLEAAVNHANPGLNAVQRNRRGVGQRRRR